MWVLPQHFGDIPFVVGPSTTYDRTDELDFVGQSLCKKFMPCNFPLNSSTAYMLKKLGEVK